MLVELEEKEEQREQALIKGLEYKRKMAKYHDAHITEKGFKEGELVLRNAQIKCISQTKGKLYPKWEGPYVLKEVIQLGTHRLTYKDGEEVTRTWHIDNLCKFFQ